MGNFNLKEYQKRYRLENKERLAIKSKLWLAANYEKVKLYQKEYRQKNKEASRVHKRNHYLKNKAKIISRERDRYNYKYKNDNVFKIKSLLRRRLLNAIGKDFKKGKAIDFLGCSINEFKEYISKQFKDGMSWDNHNIKIWHIDHIKPCSSFDLTKEIEQRKCFHYTNMQPLWAFDNYSKGDKL